MSTSRRDFLQLSATAASALSLTPVHRHGTALPDAATASGADSPRVLAHAVPLERVRVTGGPLKHAQDMVGKYLLSLDPDRMLAFYRVRAGLPKKAEPYGGWDGPGHNLTGHVAGHHLSAVTGLYLATGDARLKARADYLVAGLDEVQRKNGDGYLSALEGGREAFAALSKGQIRAAAFDLNGLWSPWYVLHKTFAGLRDAYRRTGNRTALNVSVRFATWAEGTLAPLNDAQIQKMLLTEHGGMTEVLADLYTDTGDKRWLALSQKFEHRAFTDALKRHQDNLSGKHGNCQIPKMVGSAARYLAAGAPEDYVSAAFFWDRVVQHHSYATGGHGLDEYFGDPDHLAKRVDGRVAESCNVYNMLKLTRQLFSVRPDAFYADFHERAQFNHVLSSMDSADGRLSYMVPVGHREQQEYQRPYDDFTCCVGTGMENHGLHGAGIYFESPDQVWVNLYVPSTAQLERAGISIAQDSTFPDGDSATLKITAARPRELTLAVRRPWWAGDDFAIKVNGTALPQPTLASMRAGGAGGNNSAGIELPLPSSSYVEIKRVWQSGDTIELALPKTLHLQPTPDDHRVAAIMWGPLVLAGDQGARNEGRPDGAALAGSIPALVAADRPLTEWIHTTSVPGNFTIAQVARLTADPAHTVQTSLLPFYRTFEKQYSVYWDVITPAEFDARASAIASERERQLLLDAVTVGQVQPGNSESEKAANYQTDGTNRRPMRADGRTGRGGAGWFSYDLPIDPASPTATLLVTYYNGNVLPNTAPAAFDILVEGAVLAHVTPDSIPGFHDVTYALPAPAFQGKSKVTVRFQAGTDGRIAPIYSVRTLRTAQ